MACEEWVVGRNEASEGDPKEGSRRQGGVGHRAWVPWVLRGNEMLAGPGESHAAKSWSWRLRLARRNLSEIQGGLQNLLCGCAETTRHSWCPERSHLAALPISSDWSTENNAFPISAWSAQPLLHQEKEQGAAPFRSVLIVSEPVGFCFPCTFGLTLGILVRCSVLYTGYRRR